MRLVWVPQWTVLPVIVEDRAMGDVSVEASRQLSASPAGVIRGSGFGNYEDGSAGRKPWDYTHTLTVSRLNDNMLDARARGATPQQYPSNSQPLISGSDINDHSLGRETPPNNFNMLGMSATLPAYPRGASQVFSQDSQRFAPSMGSMANYGAQNMQGQPAFNAVPYSMHPSQFAHSFQDTAAMYQQMQSGHRSYSGGPSPVQSSFPSGSYIQGSQSHYPYFTGQAAQMGQMNTLSMFHQGSPPHPADINARMYHGDIPVGSNQAGQFLSPMPQSRPGQGSSQSSSNSIPSTPRGPPRKPKQSGHALWVGNLPTGAAVRDLKDHFSRDATKDIESVFLISKSNCAFVNYRSESACVAAMNRFHDSRFQGVRLVCRLRRGLASTTPVAPPPVPGAPAAPSALMPESKASEIGPEASNQLSHVSSRGSDDAAASFRRGSQTGKVPDRYFIMKSLTLEDMQLSVRNKIWATQAHNEQALNEAYESAEAVYLIFSANKSGEYFGYARMVSPINDEASADLDWVPRSETTVDDPDIPRSITTPATEFAPRGRIIDDSARGTIFWEADAEEALSSATAIGDGLKEDVAEEVDESAIETGSHSFGKPFKIEWLSPNRLPFFRTRGLRNPWNANREVKIARDGTELETTSELKEMVEGSPDRPPTFRIGSLPGFLPVNDTPVSTRGQKLPGLIRDRSSVNIQELKKRRQIKIEDESGNEDGDLESNADSFDVPEDRSPSTKRKPPTHERRGSGISDISQVMHTPQMRSMRLIGNTNPRYQWEKYFKTQEELRQMKKPIRQYYERNNRLIQSYLYIDRLLDSSLPHNLLQEYNEPSRMSNGDVPPTIREESASSPSECNHPSADMVKKPVENGTETQIKVKRTPKALYRLPNERSPLLSEDDTDRTRTEELEAGAEDDDEAESGSRVVTVAIYINLAANAILLAGKIAVIALTSSLSVLASLVDAALDFLSTAIVWTTTQLISRQDQYRYPVGRRRLEPIGVLVFSVVMITAFFQVLLECFNRLTSGDHSIVQLGLPSIIIMTLTVAIKAACWFWCRLVKNSSVQALAQDAMTDVVFNTFSIIFPIVGFYANLWWLDALGGALLSLYVILNWSTTSTTHIKHLTGAAASAEDRNVLLYLTMRFASAIDSIQGCQAYHAGDKLNVEVDVVLDEKMTLRDSHDLGESLQYVLESVPSVDRAFVHLDYKRWNLPSHLMQQAD
ncbi:uncharacterized protein KY384_009043 [Bacidia gigantensis]|uniref:uncharacterized protein n=1 Tax=Bacidia gigantensis TaxID=2732470 RepID=UPI001D0479DC|nr:uncharacterized protein KY384_009043 [Bacidia gigantensis]KAG8525399.1 hypothetical protein KY384_009043 [Bacidia gigantensis]